MSFRYLQSCLFILILPAVLLTAACGQSPALQESDPADGETNVELDIGKIRLVFNQKMNTESHTLWMSDKGEFPPQSADNAAPWKDDRTFEFNIGRLNPNTQYAFQLNSESRTGFQTVKGDPLPVTVIRFQSGPAKAASSREIQLGETVKEEAKRELPKQEKTGHDSFSSGEAGGKSLNLQSAELKWNAKQDQVSKMTQIIRIKLNLTYRNQWQETPQIVDNLTKIQCIDRYEQVRDGLPVTIRRRIVLAQSMVKDPMTGEVMREDMPILNNEAELQMLQDGSYQVTRMIEGHMGNAEYVAESAYWFSVLPDRTVRPGETWELTGERLRGLLTALDCRNGRFENRLQQIYEDPQGHFEVAKMEGNLSAVVDLGEGIEGNVQGTMTTEFIPSAGLPFLRHLKSTVQVNTRLNTYEGPLQVTGTGEIEAVEERALLDSWPEAGQSYGNSDRQYGGPQSGSNAFGSQQYDSNRMGFQGSDSQQFNRYGSGSNNSLNNNPQQKMSGAGGRNSGVYLSLYKEQYQGAFYILIPKGWRPEGGMIPSGVGWNVVDLVENNIKFRVASPDGKSFFGWYPRFYFQDPALLAQSSMGILQKQYGEVINGCWLYPYMGIEDYVRTIVFGQLAANEFVNPRIIGQAAPAPELMPWVPKTASRYQAGYVNIECSVNGVPSAGRIYTIIYDIQNLLWTTVGTWGWIAPKSRSEQDERIMEICLRSFQLDPQWVQRASAAAAQRGRQYNDVIRQMNQIDQDIQKNRAQTNSDIMHENYKVLTGQIETLDPETGQKKYLPMYNNAYTDGQGNYFLRDYDDGTLPFENASEWRKLDIVNRLDPGYRGEGF